MAIRIDDSFAASSDLRSGQVGRPQQEIQQGTQARQQSTESPGDSASLSSLGTELARALANEPPDVVNRIDQLQQAVASGNFSAPAEQVASAVIDDALRAEDLGGSSVNLAAPQTSSPNAPPAP